ncbi:BhlA/UviB family holin-like peptide [Paenibacillus cookii]|uniref:SPBc2 prophage-derived protein BhlA n=1 Tax=Paenibacillus cookii TaxID=157839 RepID=A0ABQ4LX60_9BACL|nr:BhlA/UviB family holin-like peptide [Paenibacillus cookii]KHF35874.1 Bacteriocin UviB precursor [Paenibacillus sp. P1XP2]GIO67849.1 SPBc2 prophage-derived protein BhlA [Paenibacillus cookii]
MTETDLLKYFLTQGPFAALFVWLLIYVMRTNKEREGRLQDLLDKFSDKYDVIIGELRDIKEHFPRDY